MSDAVFDRGVYFPSPMTDWYRERPFKVAFVLSLLIHAALLAFVPGFRAVVIEQPQVLNVEIMQPEQPQLLAPREDVAPPAPVTIPPPQRSVEEKVVRPEPEPPPLPRAEIVPPQPRPEVRAEPPPVSVEPRPEPPPLPAVEPRPEPRQEPRAEVRPEPQAVPKEAPPPAQDAQPRIEPETPPVQLPSPPVVATVPPAPSQPVVQSKEPSPSADPSLLLTYGQSISKEIRRYQKYPPVAQRKGWEGTAEVLLQIAPDGKVTNITLGKSSGRSILDEEALNMVRKASPLPPAPQNLRGRELTVTVPIVFKLQS